MPDAALRLLIGFAVVTFLVTASLGVYACLLTEIIPGSSWRARCLWRFGLTVVAVSIAWVAGTLLIEFSRAVGL